MFSEWVNKTWLRLRALFKRRQLDRDLEDEVAFHLARREQTNREAGLDAEEARYAARRQFGNVTSAKERSREMWTFPSFEALWQDVRFALRLLRKSPTFTSVAVLSLALAIGANTTVFTLLNALLLRELLVHEPGQLVGVSLRSSNGESSPLSLPVFRELSHHQQVFSSLFGWWGDGVFNVEVNGKLSQADIWAVTGNFYSELGVSPLAGRLLMPEDVNLDGGAPTQAAVLGYGFWQRNYSGDPSVLGKIVRIEGVPFTILGIMHQGFTGMSIDNEPDLTIPLTAGLLLTSETHSDLSDPSRFWISSAGRLKDGVTLQQARAHLEVLWPAVQSATLPPDFAVQERESFLSARLEVISIARGEDWFLRSHFTRPLYVLMGVTGLILLIACANLATLMLARAGARSQEMSVRVALGAGRWRLVRQLITETLLLSTAGALAGIFLAFHGSHALVDFIMHDYLVPPALNISPDLRVVAFTGMATVLTGILFGVAPAMRAMRSDPANSLQQNSRTIGRGTGRWGQLLVCSQVALSLVLVMGASLFVRSLLKLRAIDPGFRSNGVLAVELFPVPGGYKNIHDDAYYPELVRRIAALPGVRAASLSNFRPGSIFVWKQPVSPVPAAGTTRDELQAAITAVSPGFFETMGISLLEGRDAAWTDDRRAPRAAIISQDLSWRLFPSGGAIGRRIRVGTDLERQSIEVVGVVSDARILDVHDPNTSTVYLPFLQETKLGHWGNLEVLTAEQPAGLAESIRKAIESLGHEYPLRITTVAHELDRTLLQERLTAILSAFFGALALLLATIGLYGLVSYTVTQRTRELGIRVALGAQRGQILRMILRQTLLLSGAGVAIGVPCSLLAAQFIANQLYGLSPDDPITLLGVVLVMLVTMALAGCLPARRATHVDPMVSLRHE